jgi:hypothetical protein
MGPENRSRALIVSLAVVFQALPGLTRETWAQQTLVGSGNGKPPFSDSYMITSDGRWLWDGSNRGGLPNKARNLAVELHGFPGPRLQGPVVDVVMQQCFGGGFAAGMDATLRNYTLTTAANWNEFALNDTAPPLDNFTRAWTDSLPRSEGLYQHYLDATRGAAATATNAAVVQDPYAAGGRLFQMPTKSAYEDPLFASPDRLAVGQPQPNNTRDITGANQFVVLFAPQITDQRGNAGAVQPRFGENIDNMYAALRSIGVPANQIIVLYGNKAKNATTSSGKTPINGPATLENFSNATALGKDLYGDLLLQKAPRAPTANDHLLVYTTGHGDSVTRVPTLVANATTNKNAKLLLLLPQATQPVNSGTNQDGGVSNAGMMNLEVAFSRYVNPTGVTLKFDGQNLGSPLDEHTSPLDDLSPMIGAAYYWDVQVPLSLFDTNLGASATIEIDGASTAANSAKGITYDFYGDSYSVVATPTPEPATIVLFGTGLATMLLGGWRRFRGHRGR